MTLSGTIQNAPNGSLGFDTNTVLTLPNAQRFHNDGFKFCFRYLSLSAGQAAGDLTTAEANHILDSGLALMPVQHVRSPGWHPTGTLGIKTGTNAANNAKSVGFPDGINVWMDLEGVAPGTAAADVIDYCNNWFVEVEAAGYVPGIYVGFNAILNGKQLFNDLKFQHYWKAGGNPPVPVTRGYQMLQTIQNPPQGEVLHGINIDRDKTKTDDLGGTAIWLVRP
jgi:hypothetical protein